MTTMKTYRVEYEEWRTFLNQEITYFMVGAGLAIQALDDKDYMVFMVFAIVFSIAYHSKKFPRLIETLRKKKRTRTRAENYKYHGMLKTDFGAFTSFLPYTIACIYLGSILAGIWN